MANLLGAALRLLQLAATPATPPAGESRFYFKSDGKPYYINSDGVEVAFGTGGGGFTMPPGIVEAYVGSSPPSGWLLANGQEVARSSPLGLVLGTTYGVGNGSTTCNVPNLGGRVVLGAGTATGSSITAGARVLGTMAGLDTLNSANLPPHTHSTPDHVHPFDLGNTQGTTTTVLAKATSAVANSQATGPYNPSQAGGGTTGNGSFNNNAFAPPHVVLNWIIKT